MCTSFKTAIQPPPAAPVLRRRVVPSIPPGRGQEHLSIAVSDDVRGAGGGRRAGRGGCAFTVSVAFLAGGSRTAHAHGATEEWPAMTEQNGRALAAVVV